MAGPALVLLIATGCSSSGPLTRSGPAGSTGTTAAAPSTSSPATSAPAGGGPTVKVTPSTGLAATQTVLVEASGFSPGLSLVVTECAAKGTATSASDCDLPNLTGVTADSGGNVSVHFRLTKGPFGANKIVCSVSQRCLVSVTEAKPSPTEEADAEIAFA